MLEHRKIQYIQRFLSNFRGDGQSVQIFQIGMKNRCQKIKFSNFHFGYAVISYTDTSKSWLDLAEI